MAQFDVHRTRDGDLLLDCQSDLLADLNTRFVVPLQTFEGSTRIPARFNPTLAVDGEQWVMKTHFAASVIARDLGRIVASLQHERDVIMAALDFLLSGY